MSMRLIRVSLRLLLTFAIAVLAGCGASAHTTTSSAKPTATRTTTRVATRAGTEVTQRTVPALIPPSGAPPRSITVPVLTYHRVHTLPAVGQPDLIVDPTTFVGELEALQAGGYHSVSQAQIFGALYRGAPLPLKPVLISFDDGYVDDVRTILPALKRVHMVATFFVITGRTSEPGFVDAAQIRELDRAGMDVGDHTAHHVDLTGLTASELATETAGSRRALETMLGHPVYFFAYPFGRFNPTVTDAVRAAGFTMAYTTASGTTQSTTSPLTMPRIHVGRAETPSGLVATLGSS